MTRLGRSHAGILKVTAGPEVITADSVHRRPLQPVTGDVPVLPARRASRRWLGANRYSRGVVRRREVPPNHRRGGPEGVTLIAGRVARRRMFLDAGRRAAAPALFKVRSRSSPHASDDRYRSGPKGGP